MDRFPRHETYLEPETLHPARLPPGTRVGPWLVQEQRGHGAFGAVYRAIGAEDSPGPVALKLALHPRNERFAREVELLSRIHHPNVPRLLGHGEWLSPGGRTYPYLAMEWVEGTSLYDWAREHQPTSRQVLSCLARVARALEATHASGGLHRDVKGDNILVRHSDGQPLLTDFGSGHFVVAATLTWPPFPPGTPPYRAPEAWRYVRRRLLDPVVPYAPGPADDVFALGVTAFRLLTGEYLPEPDQVDIENVERVLDGRCCAELRTLISRMLSMHPEARGSARELAEALEDAAREAGQEADVPLIAQEQVRPSSVNALPRPVPLRVPRRSRSHPRIPVSVGVPLLLGVVWLLSTHLPGVLADAHVSEQPGTKDGGTVAVGDSALTAPASSNAPPSALAAIALDVPPKPVPGQRRTDSHGRCLIKGQIPIQGYCWLKLALDRKGCEENGYLFKDDACYAPVFQAARPATSGPKD